MWYFFLSWRIGLEIPNLATLIVIKKNHTLCNPETGLFIQQNVIDNLKIFPEVGERGKVNITQLVVLNMIQMQSMLFINSFRKGSIFIKNLAYTYKLITRMKVYW